MKKKSKLFNSLKNQVDNERKYQIKKEVKEFEKMNQEDILPASDIRKEFVIYCKNHKNMSYQEMEKEFVKNTKNPIETQKILRNTIQKTDKWKEVRKKLQERFYDVRKPLRKDQTEKTIEEVKKRRDEQKPHPSNYKRSTYYTSIWWKTFSAFYLNDTDKCEQCKHKKAIEIHHNEAMYGKKTFYEDKHMNDLMRICKTCHMTKHKR